jgi:hypothetical protein
MDELEDIDAALYSKLVRMLAMESLSKLRNTLAHKEKEANAAAAAPRRRVRKNESRDVDIKSSAAASASTAAAAASAVVSGESMFERRLATQKRASKDSTADFPKSGSRRMAGTSDKAKIRHLKRLLQNEQSKNHTATQTLVDELASERAACAAAKKRVATAETVAAAASAEKDDVAAKLKYSEEYRKQMTKQLREEVEAHQ